MAYTKAPEIQALTKTQTRSPPSMAGIYLDSRCGADGGDRSGDGWGGGGGEMGVVVVVHAVWFPWLP